MSTGLYDNEWKYLFEVATLIAFAETYEDTCNTLLQRIKALIPYSSGIIFQASRENGDVKLTNPISTEPVNDETDHSFFIEGNYPHWNMYLMKPSTSVFRQSEIISDAKWETTRVYRELWQPKNNFYGLFASLVHDDTPLAVIGLLRERAQGDFTTRDLDILKTIKDLLELKFYAIISGKTHKTSGGSVYSDRLLRAIAPYNLTKRETEIVVLTCQGKSSEDMCRQLFITHATLSKHLSNIYSKSGARNRTDLFGLFAKLLN
ncbi:MAG: LuxR C-terminal-related transcriptional regulator [Oscillospiraceae bacterium]|jgi:DNA-binding CsgD family transcriptional regulator|nr:LuxR C-terminal-related transcriptional regulator [Oscillospiraceae bacterium]